MNKRKALTLLLSLAILLSLALPAATARADDGGIGEDNGDINEVGTEIDGLILNKTAVYNEQTGRYTITLEAYATGEKVISEVTEDVPTDIVLVLDQSGSMTEDIGTVSFKQYEDENNYWGTTYHTRNQDYYEYRHNGGSANLWHKLGDDSYVSVSVTKQEQMEYMELSDLKNYETSWGSLTENCYYYYRNNLYEKIGDVYSKVELDMSGNWWDGYVYTYTFSSDGTTVTSNGNEEHPDFGSHAPLYAGTIDDAQTVYSYTYTDANNNVQTIGTSIGAETVFSPTLYERVTSTSGGGSRLAAIQTVVTNFANAVTTKAKGADGTLGTADDVNHRIAVVGFASGDSYSGENYNYGNTEVFVGSNQYKYGSAAEGQYKNAFQDMNTEAGYANVIASKNALAAEGGTLTNLGIEMANGIFGANPILENTKRNRVVIVFTDGAPGWSGYEEDVANSANTQAGTAKNTYGATVYSVGIFSGADATSAGVSNGTDIQKANWFMQNLSSNNGTPQTPSYYLSAADVGTLNNIFQQISDQIESGGSSTTLSSDTVIKDIIAPQFELPANATAESINLYTAESNGSVNSWKTREPFAGSVSLGTNGNSVSVSGFSFKDNWCGNQTINGQETFHDGKKLIIEFTVQPKAGFLGGNDVFTNDGAGIYENAESKDPLMEFNKPTVNVPIKDVAVTATDKNVYLLGKVTLDQLKSGSTITVGAKEGVSEGIKLDLSKDNYGLEPWQTAYVTITAKIKDENGNEITGDLSSLVDDKEYTVEVKVEPMNPNPVSTEGTKAEAKTGKNEPAAKINVFKPVLTYKDSEAYYGDVAPTDYIGNLVSEVWKHGDTIANPDTMFGTAPTLEKTYTPGDGIDNGKINTKQDIGVDVKVEISKADAAGTTTKTDVTDKTTFIHTDCEGKTCTLPDGKEFLIHVKTCTLTITKAGNVANEPFVFTVNKDDVKYTEVTIVGADSVTIAELPVGTYSITEDTGWSWRYTPSYSNDGKAELAASAPNGEIICTNTSKTDKWLNDYAVKSNTYQTGTPATDSNN